MQGVRTVGLAVFLSSLAQDFIEERCGVRPAACPGAHS